MSPAVATDWRSPAVPQDHEGFVFRARGFALRLHPQNEGPTFYAGIHPDTWDEWAELALEALRLRHRHGVKLAAWPENCAQVDVGGVGRSVTFYAPTMLSDDPIPSRLRSLAEVLADAVPVERVTA